jgi:hypothetical protein
MFCGSVFPRDASRPMNLPIVSGAPSHDGVLSVFELNRRLACTLLPLISARRSDVIALAR